MPDPTHDEPQNLRTYTTTYLHCISISQQNWEAEPTTEDLLNEKERKRQRFGHEVDFDDFAMPLKQNIDKKIHEFQMQTDS